jgi:enoyl-CoA hydratase/carnithine racemase
MPWCATCLLTGRSFNATKAQQIGLVSQVVAKAKPCARLARLRLQMGKFDRDHFRSGQKIHQADSATTSCARKSIFSANCFRGLRCKRD